MPYKYPCIPLHILATQQAETPAKDFVQQKADNQPMTRITGLYVYPIKSCAGTALDHAELDARGIAHDRHWVLTKPDGKFITQRVYPKMALIKPDLTADGLTITAPDMPPLMIPYNTTGEARQVVVWDDTINGVDEGEQAAQWFSRYMGLPLRLIRQADTDRRMVDPRAAITPNDHFNLADGFPLLIISESSLADLNDRLLVRGADPVPMNRFRPNIVVTDCAPYAEDTWHMIHAGDVELHGVKPCGRCVLTTVNQATGVKDHAEPLATLNTYRKMGDKVMFGQNVIHRVGTGYANVLHIGDEIRVG